jgi:hypothetical protein
MYPFMLSCIASSTFLGGGVASESEDDLPQPPAHAMEPITTPTQNRRHPRTVIQHLLAGAECSYSSIKTMILATFNGSFSPMA